MAKKFNEYKYGVGLEYDAKSFKEVKDVFKGNLDTLEKLVKSYEDILKINPDADLSTLFKEVSKVKEITNGMSKSGNAMEGFVDKGVLERIANTEQALVSLASKSDLVEKSLQDMLSMFNELKGAGELVKPGTFDNLFGPGSQLDNMKQAHKNIDEIKAIQKTLNDVRNRAERARSNKQEFTDNEVNGFINQIDTLKNKIKNAKPSEINQIAVKWKKAIENLTTAIQSKNYDSDGMDKTYIYSEIDDMSEVLQSKRVELQHQLDMFKSLHKDYESKVRQTGAQVNTQSLLGDKKSNLGSGAIDLIPNISEAEWVKDINAAIKNIEGSLQKVHLKPTFKNTSSSLSQEVNDDIAKISHDIKVDLKVTDNLDDYTKRIATIDKTIDETQKKLKNKKIKVEYSVAREKDFQSKLKQFKGTIATMRKDAETKLANIPATITLGNKAEVLSEVQTLASQIQEALKGIKVEVVPSTSGKFVINGDPNDDNPNPPNNPPESDDKPKDNNPSKGKSKSSGSKSKSNDETSSMTLDEAKARRSALESIIQEDKKMLEDLKKNGLKSEYFSKMGKWNSKTKYFDRSEDVVSDLRQKQEKYLSHSNGANGPDNASKSEKYDYNKISPTLRSQKRRAEEAIAANERELETLDQLIAGYKEKNEVMSAPTSGEKSSQTSNKPKQTSKSKKDDPKVSRTLQQFLDREKIIKSDLRILKDSPYGYLSPGKTDYTKQSAHRREKIYPLVHDAQAYEYERVYQSQKFDNKYKDVPDEELSKDDKAEKQMIQKRIRELDSELPKIKSALEVERQSQISALEERLRSLQQSIQNEINNPTPDPGLTERQKGVLSTYNKFKTAKNILDTQGQRGLIETDIGDIKGRLKSRFPKGTSSQDRLKKFIESYRELEIKKSNLERLNQLDTKDGQAVISQLETEQELLHTLYQDQNIYATQQVSSYKKKIDASKALTEAFREQQEEQYNNRDIKVDTPKGNKKKDNEPKFTSRQVSQKEKDVQDKYDKAIDAQQKLNQNGWRAISQTGLPDLEGRLKGIVKLDKFGTDKEKFNELISLYDRLQQSAESKTEEGKQQAERLKNLLEALYQDQKTYTDNQVESYKKQLNEFQGLTEIKRKSNAQDNVNFAKNVLSDLKRKSDVGSNTGGILSPYLAKSFTIDAVTGQRQEVVNEEIKKKQDDYFALAQERKNNNTKVTQEEKRLQGELTAILTKQREQIEAIITAEEKELGVVRETVAAREQEPKIETKNDANLNDTKPKHTKKDVEFYKTALADLNEKGIESKYLATLGSWKEDRGDFDPDPDLKNAVKTMQDNYSGFVKTREQNGTAVTSEEIVLREALDSTLEVQKKHLNDILQAEKEELEITRDTTEAKEALETKEPEQQKKSKSKEKSNKDTNKNQPKYTKEQVEWAKAALKALDGETKDGGGIASARFGQLGKWDSDKKIYTAEPDTELQNLQNEYLNLRKERLNKGLLNFKTYASPREKKLASKLGNQLGHQRKRLQEIIKFGEENLGIIEETSKVASGQSKSKAAKSKPKTEASKDTENKKKSTQDTKSKKTEETQSQLKSTQRSSKPKQESTSTSTSKPVTVSAPSVDVNGKLVDISSDVPEANKLAYNQFDEFVKQRMTELSGYNKSKTSVNVDPESGRIKNASVYFKSKDNASGYIERYGWKKVPNPNGQAQEIFDQISSVYTENLGNYLKQIKNQDDASIKYNNRIADLEKNLDPNANKTLANTKYTNELQSRISQIKEEVAKLDAIDANGERTLFSTEELLNQKKIIESMVLDAKSFISQSKNENYAPIDFDSKDVTTQKGRYQSQLNAFIEQVKRSGEYTGAFKDQLDGLQNTLSKVKVGKDLKEYQAQFTTAKSDFSGRRNYGKLYDDLSQSVYKGIKLDNQINSDYIGPNMKPQLEAELELEREIYQQILQQLQARQDLYDIKRKESVVEGSIDKALRDIDKANAAKEDQRFKNANNSMIKDINDAQKQYDKFYASIDNAPQAIAEPMFAKIDQYNNLMSKLRAEQNKLQQNPQFINDDNYRNEFNNTLKQVQLLQSELKDLQKSEADVSVINKLANQLTTFEEKLKRSGKYTDEFKAKIEQLRGAINSAVTIGDVAEFKFDFNNLQTDATQKDTYNKWYKQLVDSRAEEIKLGHNIKYSNTSTQEAEAQLKKQQEISKALARQLSEYTDIYNKEANAAAWAEARAKAEESIAQSMRAQNDNQINDVSKVVNGADAKLQQMINSNPNIPIVGESSQQLEKYIGLLNNLKEKQKEIANMPSLMQDQAYKGTFDKLLLDMQQTEQEFYKLRSASESFFSKIVDIDSDIQGLDDTFNPDDIDDLHNKMLDFANSTGMGQAELIKFNDAQKTATFEIRSGANEVQSLTVAYDRGTNSLGRYVAETRKVETGAQKFINNIGRGFSHLTQYIASFGSFYEIIAQIRRGFEYVKEIDTALTELKKVTNETDATYSKFLQTASQTASVIGSTVANITTMTAEWARLGYTIQESADLAKSTGILLNVSEFTDATTASEALISTIQAFQYTADESMHVVDVLNEVGEFIARR